MESVKVPLSVAEIVATCRGARCWLDAFTYHFYRGRWIFEAPDGVTHWVCQSDMPEIAAHFGWPEKRGVAV
jgi:hypothetical protein